MFFRLGGPPPSGRLPPSLVFAHTCLRPRASSIFPCLHPHPADNTKPNPFPCCTFFSCALAPLSRRSPCALSPPPSPPPLPSCLCPEAPPCLLPPPSAPICSAASHDSLPATTTTPARGASVHTAQEGQRHTPVGHPTAGAATAQLPPPGAGLARGGRGALLLRAKQGRAKPAPARGGRHGAKQAPRAGCVRCSGGGAKQWLRGLHGRGGGRRGEVAWLPGGVFGSWSDARLIDACLLPQPFIQQLQQQNVCDMP